MNLMENARQQAAAIVAAAYDKAVAAGELPQAELPAVTVETPKDAANGDWLLPWPCNARSRCAWRRARSQKRW